MKRIKRLLLFCIIPYLLLTACKKDKAEAPPPDPIAVYNFDDGSAQNDMSPLLQGSIKGSVLNAADSLGNPKSAFKFYETTYVEVADSDFLDFVGNQFTIAAWIRPSEILLPSLVKKGDVVNDYSPYSLDIYTGVVRAFVRTNTKEQFIITGETQIKPLVWQHIAMTFTGEQLTVYYNGKNEGTVPVDRPLNMNTGKLFIGASDKSFPSTAFIVMDNVRIYDKALTAAQIKGLYQDYKQ